MADPERRQQVNRLVEDVLAGRVDRRGMLRRAAALGVVLPAALTMRVRPALGQEATPGAAAPAATPLAGTPGGTLRAIVVDDPKSLDIHVTQLAQSRNVMASVYETLTILDPTDFTTKGLLAKSWTFPEPNVLDLVLQNGVTFHGGQPFTAEDVKFTIEYVKDPQTGSPNATILEAIDTVEVVDPQTARLNLKYPWAAILDDLATIQIYSKDATIATISTSPNGTGPFTWGEWIPGDHITLRKNPNYWRPGLPYLDELVFRPIKEKATSLAVLEAGDAEVFFTPELKDKALIDGDPALASAPSLLNDAGYILYLNNNRPPMNDQNVRLAASYALDRRTFFEAFLSGQGQKNPSPWAAEHWAYNPINDDAFDVDPDRARQLLADAGYPDGRGSDGTQLAMTIVFPRGYPEWRQGSEMFQAAMAELGVEVRVEELELATWIDRIVNTDDYDLSWDYHFQRAVDPAWTLSLAFFYPPGPQNIGRYEDDELGSLIEQGGSTLEQAARTPIYHRFQERWNEIQPGLIVGEFVYYHALRADVRGFHTDPLGFQDFSGVWLDR
jgi:peptide/nickel transport system substrate-binding protein